MKEPSIEKKLDAISTLPCSDVGLQRLEYQSVKHWIRIVDLGSIEDLIESEIEYINTLFNLHFYHM